MVNEKTTNSGIGFVGLLQIMFIGLKMADFIDWSWFWVFSPFIFIGLMVILEVIILLIISFFRSK